MTNTNNLEQEPIFWAYCVQLLRHDPKRYRLIEYSFLGARFLLPNDAFLYLVLAGQLRKQEAAFDHLLQAIAQEKKPQVIVYVDDEAAKEPVLSALRQLPNLSGLGVMDKRWQIIYEKKPSFLSFVKPLPALNQNQQFVIPMATSVEILKTFQAQEKEKMKQLLGFQKVLFNRNAWGTWAIAAIIVGIFLLEEWFGGSTDLALLIRMGADSKKLVLEDHQYFRLLTSVFLHSGFLHVFFNTYALIALGTFFNRILGNARFLFVYFFSGIVGNVCSIFIGHSQVSVGASGAIWGLFGASLALAIIPSDFIPEEVRLRLRRLTLINIVINLGVSLLPMVDFWAHLGGGIGGFAASALILALASRDRPSYKPSVLMIVLAWLLSLTYAAGFAYGWNQERPWLLYKSANLHQVRMKGIDFEVSLPFYLQKVKEYEDPQGFHILQAGVLPMDPLMMEVAIMKVPGQAEANEDSLKTERMQLEEMLRQKKRKFDFVRLEKIDHYWTLHWKYKQSDELETEHFLQRRDHYVVRVSFFYLSSQSHLGPKLRHLISDVKEVQP